MSRKTGTFAYISYFDPVIIDIMDIDNNRNSTYLSSINVSDLLKLENDLEQEKEIAIKLCVKINSSPTEEEAMQVIEDFKKSFQLIQENTP